MGLVFSRKCKKPKSHDNGNTFKVIKSTLENIPQNRERIFIVAFYKQKVPNHANFSFPKPVKLTANMGTGGHNVSLLRDKFGIRKLTPKECFALQGFGDIKLPNIAISALYKQASKIWLVCG